MQEIGAHAHSALVPGARGRVVATFARSLYFTAGPQWVCVGPHSFGPGPLNALCSLPATMDWHDRGIAPGAAASVGPRSIRLGGSLELFFSEARVWRPPRFRSWTGESLRQGIAALDRMTLDRFPAAGLAAFVRPRPAPRTLEARAARSHVASIVAWLERGGASPHGSAVVRPATIDDRKAVPAPASREPDGVAAKAMDAARSLLGLGPGLTPSGDDFLGGAMIALHGTKRAPFARKLWHAIAPLVDSHTVGVSAAHLRAAARGAGGGALHEVLNAVLAGEAEALPSGLAKIDAVGHCSGWDALAGSVTVLRSRLAAQEASPTRETDVDLHSNGL